MLTTVGSFEVVDNAALTTLSFPVLTTVGGPFTVFNNAVLPTCQADNLVAQLTSIGGLAFVSGNDDAGVCP